MAKTKHFGALPTAAAALVAAALLVLVLVVVNPQTAEAALPGDNGRIAYSGWDGNDWEIFTIGATGGLSSQLTFNNTTDELPCYSPDGFRIGYLGFLATNNSHQIFTIPTTGGSRVQVTPNTAEPLHCSFTGPRGSEIVYSGFDGLDFDIYTISASGGTPTQLTFNNISEVHPVYSPNGQRIAYSASDGTFMDSEIYTIPATGGTPFQVTNNTTEDSDPSWQPRP